MIKIVDIFQVRNKNIKIGIETFVHNKSLQNYSSYLEAIRKVGHFLK